MSAIKPNLQALISTTQDVTLVHSLSKTLAVYIRKLNTLCHLATVELDGCLSRELEM